MQMVPNEVWSVETAINQLCLSKSFKKTVEDSKFEAGSEEGDWYWNLFKEIVE